MSATATSLRPVPSASDASTELPPGPSAPAVVQTVRFLFDQVRFVDECIRRFGDCFTIRLIGGPPMVVFTHPDPIRDIYTAEPEVLSYGETTADLLGPILGANSLLVLDGPRHHRQRRLLLPPFHGDRLHAYGRLMQQITADAIGRWPTGRVFPVHTEMQAITLEVIMRVVFGLEEQTSLGRLRACLLRMLQMASNPTAPLLFIPALRFDLGRWSPWGRFLRDRREFRDILLAEIAARRAVETARSADVLSMLLAARDERGEGLSDDELFDEMHTLLTAGHETTASQLAWALYQLLCHPDVLARLRDELDAASRGDELEPEAVAKLEYLDAVVKESQRLNPVAPLSGRRTRVPVRMGGRTLPAGTSVAISIYAAHRRPEAWPDPERFVPDRFLGPHPAPYTYLPFGGGDRRCLGATFAVYEMKLVLAEVVRRTRLSVVPRYRARPVLRVIVMGPSEGVPVVMNARADG
jgi:cytochrome P450